MGAANLRTLADKCSNGANVVTDADASCADSDRLSLNSGLAIDDFATREQRAAMCEMEYRELLEEGIRYRGR